VGEDGGEDEGEDEMRMTMTMTMRVRMRMRIMVRMKVLSFDIFLSDSFTVGIFISTRGICTYIYLSIFLLFDIFPFDILIFDIFTIRHFYF
jgi:hypothetical protein